jgi:hypothetical protein
MAEAEDATPYDIPGVAFSQVGNLCCFDALLSAYKLDGPTLTWLVAIVSFERASTQG